MITLSKIFKNDKNPNSKYKTVSFNRWIKWDIVMSSQIFSKATDILGKCKLYSHKLNDSIIIFNIPVAGLLFLPCGVLFGFNLFLLSAFNYNWILSLPHFIAALSALILALIIRIVKSQRLVFYHFYYLFISSIFLAISGFVILYADGN